MGDFQGLEGGDGRVNGSRHGTGVGSTESGDDRRAMVGMGVKGLGGNDG